MTTYSDPAAAYIAKVREDNRTPGEEAADRIREQHVPALLVVVEAVLALADRYDLEDEHLALATCEGHDPGPPPPPRGPRIRAAIAAELPGESRPRLRETGE